MIPNDFVFSCWWAGNKEEESTISGEGKARLCLCARLVREVVVRTSSIHGTYQRRSQTLKKKSWYPTLLPVSHLFLYHRTCYPMNCILLVYYYYHSWIASLFRSLLINYLILKITFWKKIDYSKICFIFLSQQKKISLLKNFLENFSMSKNNICLGLPLGALLEYTYLPTYLHSKPLTFPTYLSMILTHFGTTDRPHYAT